jgi:hypothetical protein
MPNSVRTTVELPEGLADTSKTAPGTVESAADQELPELEVLKSDTPLPGIAD